ncbi:hypothetical protein BHM03_00035635 [Ensete ventricosum]|nr:hypothetical protein BHM03_00035635 [Ensete ventricosum]
MRCARDHPLDQIFGFAHEFTLSVEISEFAPEVILSAKSPDSRPSSPSRPNLRICARVHPLGRNLRICARGHPLGQISGFTPDFTLSAKSPNLRPRSPSRPNLRICARGHPLGQISGFAPKFTLSAKSPDLRSTSPLARALHRNSRAHARGRTADLTQVRSAPPTCKRTPHCKDDKHGGGHDDMVSMVEGMVACFDAKLGRAVDSEHHHNIRSLQHDLRRLSSPILHFKVWCCWSKCRAVDLKSQ